MLRNEAQEDKVSGFDVMEIIVNRCHLRDFEDLKQLSQLDRFTNEISVLLGMRKVNRSLSPQTDRFTNEFSVLLGVRKVHRSLSPQTDRFTNEFSVLWRVRKVNRSLNGTVY